MEQPDREEHLSPTDTFVAFVKAFNARDVDAVYACFSSKVRAQYPKVEVEGFLERAQTVGSRMVGWVYSEKDVTDGVAALMVRVKTIPSFEWGADISLITFVWEAGEWHIDEWVSVDGEDQLELPVRAFPVRTEPGW
ncbi:hypothetical protein ES703_72118 [subsurface metagenome]